MKQILIICLTVVISSFYATAQDRVDTKDYQRYLDSKAKMEFRSDVYSSINLTTEEIITIDPHFHSYMDAKDAITREKVELIGAHFEEMEENDDRSDEMNETAEFIEKLWELEIKSEELSRAAFDTFEDKIPVMKAAQFFIYEDAVEDKVINDIVMGYYANTYDLSKVADKVVADRLRIESKVQARMKADKNKKYAKEDYQKYIDSRLDIEFKNETFNFLNIPADKNQAFSDFFDSYMAGKEMFLEEKVELLEDILTELEEEDSYADEAEEAADFKKDYWQVTIDAMEYRKDHFDILEDIIPVKEAIKFFLWEDAVEDRVKRYTYNRMYPIIKDIKLISMIELTPVSDGDITVDVEVKMDNNAEVMISDKTFSKINAFDIWVTQNKGEVDLSHEYTAAGLKSLLSIITSLKTDLQIMIPGFEAKKKTVLAAANHITADYRETTHADRAKLAFLSISDMMGALEVDNTKLRSIAMNMNNKTLMTRQANIIYSFFDQANKSMKAITKSKTTSFLMK